MSQNELMSIGIVAGAFLLFLVGVIFPRKKDPGPPKLADAYKKAERIIKDLELINYMLADTLDWKRMTEANKIHSIEQIQKFYTDSHFKCSVLRDEIMLALQRIPNVRFIRKGPSGSPTV